MSELLSPGAKVAVAVLAWGSSALFGTAILMVFAILGFQFAVRRSTAGVDPAIDALSIDTTKIKGDALPTSRLELSIDGMHCANCSGAVERAVKSVEGVTEVEVRLLSHNATVVFKDSSTADLIIQAVEDCGFGAVVNSVAEIETHTAPEAEESTLHMSNATLDIKGMTCSQCSGAVERTLTGIDGVLEADVNLLTHKAQVKFSTATTAGALLEAVENCGFEAALLNVQEGVKPQVVSEAVLSVQGMTCSQCSGAVERALVALPGVMSATVDLLAHRARVTFAAPCTQERLSDTVDELGFEASVESCSDVQVAARPGGSVSSAQKFCDSLAETGDKACLVRVKFPSADALKKALARLKDRAGVAGTVATRRGEPELRISYWSHEVGGRDLIKELGDLGGAWAGDSRVSGDGGQRAERENLRRYLASVPPTAAIFVLSMVIPNMFEDAAKALQEPICCGGALSHQTFWLILLSLPVQFWVALPMHKSAVTALRTGHLSMDVLVSMGTNLAFLYSVIVTMVWIIIGLEMPEALSSASMLDHGSDMGLSAGQPAMNHSEHMHDAHMNHGEPRRLQHASIAAPPHFFEASAMLLSILMLGQLMGAHAKRRTGDALRHLASKFPSEARLAEGGVVPCDLLQVKDIVAISDGEMVPCDGVIVSGQCQLDESVLTGEDRPVLKSPGDFVVGGSKCVDGAATFEASAVGTNTAMSQVAAMVEAAQSSRPEIERLAGKVASVFVPTILALAFVTFLTWAILVSTGRVEVPTMLGGRNYIAEARLAEQSFFISRFALSLMMMACPCAFGLAAPTAVLVATGHVAKWGCLVKSGRAIELGQQLRAIVLDKTGTITIGKPKVTSSAVAADHPALQLSASRQLKEGETAKAMTWLPSRGQVPSATPAEEHIALLWLAVGSIEAPSQHPLGKALSAEAQRLVASIPEAQDWHSVTGCGCEGTVPGLGLVRVGKQGWVCEGETASAPQCCCEGCKCSLSENCGCRCWEGKPETAVPLLADCHSPEDSAMKNWFTEQGRAGAGVVAVSLDRQLLGGITLRDVLQPGAKEAVAALQQLGIEVWLCSGDQRTTTEAIAKEVGITHFRGEQLPTDKATLVQSLCEQGKMTGFVGDGVNDAPALAASSLGIAIGAGAHVTVEAADVVLVRSVFTDVIDFLKASKCTLRTIKSNYVWAFGFNIIGLPLAAGVLYPTVHMPPIVAGAAMAGSSLMVVGNSLLLRVWLNRVRPPTSHGAVGKDVLDIKIQQAEAVGVCAPEPPRGQGSVESV